MSSAITVPPDDAQQLGDDSGMGLCYYTGRILGDGVLPDIDIITLPGIERNPLESFGHLAAATRQDGKTATEQVRFFLPITRVAGAPFPPAGIAEPIGALMHLMALSMGDIEAISERERLERHVLRIFREYRIPVVNSPMEGKTLQELIASTVAAIPATAHLAVMPHEGGEIILCLAIWAGTRIIIGASRGIARGLDDGLHELILHWMRKVGGLPSKEKRKRAAKSSVSVAADAPAKAKRPSAITGSSKESEGNPTPARKKSAVPKESKSKKK